MGGHRWTVHKYVEKPCEVCGTITRRKMFCSVACCTEGMKNAARNGRFQKGLAPWNKGLDYPEELRRKFRHSKIPWSVEARQRRSEQLKSGQLVNNLKLGHAVKKKTGKNLTCAVCGMSFYAMAYEIRNGRLYCSNLCRSVAHKGKPNPKHGDILRVLYAEYPEKHPNRVLARQKKYGTRCEKLFADILDVQNIGYARQYVIGKKFVDFVLQEYQLAIEVDGEYWHKDGVDEARDEIIRKAGFDVVHISDRDVMSGNFTVLCRYIPAFSVPDETFNSLLAAAKRFHGVCYSRKRGDDKLGT